MFWGSGGSKSRFRSQNAQNTSLSEHFSKLRCGKSARRCGAKQISKSKCTKRFIVGALFKVAMWKKCTPLWREAHFDVKMCKAHHVRITFGRSTAPHYTTATRKILQLQVQLQQQLQQPLQLQLPQHNITLHYNYTTPHHTTFSSCVCEVLQKAQLQPPFGPSVDSLCHPCITTTHISYVYL